MKVCIFNANHLQSMSLQCHYDASKIRKGVLQLHLELIWQHQGF